MHLVGQGKEKEKHKEKKSSTIRDCLIKMQIVEQGKETKK